MQKNFQRIYFFFFLIFFVLTHLSYINNGFVWLDHGDIELKRTIIPLSSFLSAFTTRLGETGFYRPLVTIFNSVDYAVWHTYAPGYHITNLVLHLAVIFITPVFLACFFRLNPTEKIITMLVVALSPVQWLTVGVISYRQESMYAAATMLAIIAYDRINTTKLAWYYIWFLLSIVAALFAKETAIVMISLFMGIYDYAHTKKMQLKKVNRHKLFSYAAYSVVCIAYVLLRMKAVPEVWNTKYPHMNLFDAISTRFDVFAKTMFVLFRPSLPPLSDATRIVSFSIFGLAAIVSILFIIVYMMVAQKKHTVIIWGALVIAAMLPALQIIPAPRFFSSHYAYLAAIPASFLWVVVYRLSQTRSKITGIIVQTFMIGIFALYVSAMYTGGTRLVNDYSLFQPAVAEDAHFLEGHQNIGDFYFYRGGQGDFEKAENAYTKALHSESRIIAYVDIDSVLNNLAGVYTQKGAYKQAEQTLSQLEKHMGTFSTLIQYNRALVAYKSGDYKKVISLMEDPRARWDFPEAYQLYADALIHEGRRIEAEAVLKKTGIKKIF